MRKDGFGELGIQRFQNPFFQLLYDYDIFLYELQRILQDVAAYTEEGNQLYLCMVDLNALIVDRAEVDAYYLIQSLDLFEHYLEEYRTDCKDKFHSKFLSDCISRLDLIVTK